MERTRTRVRHLGEPAFIVGSDKFTGGVNRQYVFPVNRETTTDEERPWNWYIDQVRRKTATSKFLAHVGDFGGEFTSSKTEVDFGSTESVYLESAQTTFKGPLLPARPQPTTVKPDVTAMIDVPLYMNASVKSYDSTFNMSDAWPPLNQSEEAMMQLGTKMLSHLSPTAPHNSVYTSLGELRNDGLPSIPFLSFLKGGKGLPEKAGGEWLNYQFAIKPTISDVKSILKTISEADKLWKQYLRDSGRHVRRRAIMDPIVTTDSGLIATARADRVPIGTTSGLWSSVGATEHITTTTVERWFSGCYQYYVDESSLAGMDGWLKRADYLYGWKPDPSAVYNLTAWSWLLDWFTNTGDVIDNISLYLEDPFLTRYAYVMEKTTTTRNVYQRLIDNEGRSRLAQVTFNTVMKKRRRVNPFHFGVLESELDARQISILAALGLTKGRNPGSM